jgi:3-oxoacyl-[acyl-carrier-protein] synthase II
MRRVVITGVGAISPSGLDATSTFESLVAGKSGIGPITLFDASAFASQIAGECTGFDPETVVEKKRLREGGRFIHLALAAADEAVRASGFEPSEAQRERVGTFIGVGFCGIEVFEQNHSTYLEKGPRRISPYFIPATISNLAAGQVSMRFGYKGPSYCNTSACSSGGHAIGEAFEWIRRGGMDAAIAGGTEAAVTPMGIGGFASMRALSKRNDDPEAASRPFDRGRDGFVMGEGAAVLVLEEREAAIRRGATILAEIVGYGASSDAYHLTQPSPGGEGAVRAMRAALEEAQVAPSEVDYVNAHGTSTPTGDGQELMALRTVFGAHATSGLWVSSTKSMTGHLLGAAGSLEAVVTAMAIHRGLVPPTANLDDPDDEAEGFELVPHRARERKLGVAISNSFGFGGTNVTLAFRNHS